LYSFFGIFFFIDFSEYYLKLINKSYIAPEDPLYLPPYSYNICSSYISISHIIYYESFYLVEGIPFKDKYYIKNLFYLGLESKGVKNKIKVYLNKEPLKLRSLASI
jgi:hypothetical protein